MQNKATTEVKAFFRNFFESKAYRDRLKRRIMNGEADHMEILGHYYAFGKPKITVEVTPPRSLPLQELAASMSKPELALMYRLAKRLQAEANASLVEGQAVVVREIPAKTGGD